MTKDEAFDLLKKADDRIARINRLNPSDAKALLEFWRAKRRLALNVLEA